MLRVIALLLKFLVSCYAYSSFKLSDYVHLSWEYSNSSHINFEVRCKVQSWCGVGFGQTMTNTNMIVLIYMDEKVQVWDTWAVGHMQPGKVQHSILTTQSSSKTSEHIYAKFSRPIKTGSSQHNSLEPGTTTGFCWAISNIQGVFSQHSEYGQGILTLGNTQAESSWVTESKFGHDHKNHGIYMTTLWLGLVQLAIISIRYFKWTWYSYLVHGISGVVVIALTVYSASFMYKKDEIFYEGLEDEVKFHSRMGLTIAGLSLSQGFLGVVLKTKLMFGKSLSVIRVIRRVHQLLGVSLCIPALINLGYGWSIYEDYASLNLVYVFYGVLVAVYVLMELRLRFRNKLKINHSRKKGLGEPLLGEDSSHIEVLEKILGGKKWVFLDHYILDISGFMQNHPGGAYMLQRSVGQDVGKYLNGCSSADFQVNPYYHSQPARNLINHLIIGRVAFAPVLTPRDSAGSMAKMPWNLVKKTEVAKSTYCFEFTSPSWEVVQDPPGFEWMGKHFRVKASVNGETVRRYYSLVLTDLEVWKSEVEGSTPEPSNTLKLYVKVYDQGKMTNHLLGLKNSVWLRGPVGAGLALESLPSGVCLAFGAGTGLLPFLDLVYSVWRGKAHSGFELHLYVTFRDYSDSFALDLLQATQKKHPNNLKLHLNIDKSDPSQKFSAQKLTEWTGGRPVHRAWTCGPSGFNMWIEGILRSQKLPSSIIYVL